MKYLLLSLLMLSCSSIKHLNLEEINFRNSRELAHHQDSLITVYKNGGSLSISDLKSMQNNIWVATASVAAPSNLVVRQWCLIDLFTGKPSHRKRLRRIIDCLSYGKKNDRIWAEGFSYWRYTRMILDEWSANFNDNHIISLIEQIDDGFIKTVYLSGSVWYPAPFGDLRDEHLNEDLIGKCWSTKSATRSGSAAIIELICTDSSTTYNIAGRPIGLNVHIPKNSYEIAIIDGFPDGFMFYEGYNTKYSTKEDEIKDIMDSLRLETIGNCR